MTKHISQNAGLSNVRERVSRSGQFSHGPSHKHRRNGSLCPTPRIQQHRRSLVNSNLISMSCLGLVLLSELSRKRIRSITKIIKVGRREPVLVLRVDPEKGKIYISELINVSFFKVILIYQNVEFHLKTLQLAMNVTLNQN